MSHLKSIVLTPQFVLAFVVVGAWCSFALSAIAAGDDVEAWSAVLIGLPVFVVLLGFGIGRAASQD